MIEASVLDVLVSRATVELARVSVARPPLAKRCDRAVEILAAHAADPRAGVLVAQTRGGVLVGFRVRSQGKDPSRAGRRYSVEASGSWPCNCPDARLGNPARRRGSSLACKHGLAAWSFMRAASGALSPEVERVAAEVSVASLAVAEVSRRAA